MNVRTVSAFVFAVAGSTMIGLWGGSAMLGIGVYFCIAAIGAWD